MKTIGIIPAQAIIQVVVVEGGHIMISQWDEDDNGQRVFVARPNVNSLIALLQLSIAKVSPQENNERKLPPSALDL